VAVGGLAAGGTAVCGAAWVVGGLTVGFAGADGAAAWGAGAGVVCGRLSAWGAGPGLGAGWRCAGAVVLTSAVALSTLRLMARAWTVARRASCRTGGVAWATSLGPDAVAAGAGGVWVAAALAVAGGALGGRACSAAPFGPPGVSSATLLSC